MSVRILLFIHNEKPLTFSYSLFKMLADPPPPIHIYHLRFLTHIAPSHADGNTQITPNKIKQVYIYYLILFGTFFSLFFWCSIWAYSFSLCVKQSVNDVWKKKSAKSTKTKKNKSEQKKRWRRRTGKTARSNSGQEAVKPIGPSEFHPFFIRFPSVFLLLWRMVA